VEVYFVGYTFSKKDTSTCSCAREKARCSPVQQLFSTPPLKLPPVRPPARRSPVELIRLVSEGGEMIRLRVDRVVR
jgi:hypothetical protein